MQLAAFAARGTLLTPVQPALQHLSVPGDGEELFSIQLAPSLYGVSPPQMQDFARVELHEVPVRLFLQLTEVSPSGRSPL